MGVMACFFKPKTKAMFQEEQASCLKKDFFNGNGEEESSKKKNLEKDTVYHLVFLFVLKGVKKKKSNQRPFL